MAPDTGSPRTDAQSDFGRARRRRAISRLAGRLRREPDDVDMILPFDEVICALGRTGERRLGLQVIELDSVVGTVDRSNDFDRAFRPTTPRVRERFERIAAAVRRGEPMPPIEVYRVGDLHFVADGHHRVAVGRAQGQPTIEAYVTEVTTTLPPPTALRPADLPLKGHERLFFERVPLPPALRVEIHLSDEWRYASLAEGVEAFGFRLMQDRRRFMTREEVARAWYDHEYRPIVDLLREAGLAAPGQETEAYIRIVTLRYLLLRTHAWDDEVLERLLGALETRGPATDDTLVHQIRRELRTPGPRRVR